MSGAPGLDRFHFPDSPELRRHVAEALAEDLGAAGDVTTDAIFPAGAAAEAEISAREDLALCGLPLAPLVFEAAAGLGAVSLDPLAADGDRVGAGTPVLRLTGSARAVLACERTVLNFLQRLSGIATLTARYAQAAGPSLKVCDTRKTNPGWRHLDKYAVRCGGGANHRIGLYDMAMVKDTHADAAGGLRAALARLRGLRGRVPVAAEARDLDEVRAALDEGVDLIMLDNMADAEMARAVALIGDRADIEATGGITLERLPALAALGIRRVSVGALTHSARACDFGMKTALRR
ncbi:MAG: carboxylating nicotinate-nucleotide diphosphorylase [Candidatus Sumerlaeia bacterium]|nr:carboxylating nicotinate-nucleotide diphosphorylase [Candidatus Sumerlaeia bacterium]